MRIGGKHRILSLGARGSGRPTPGDVGRGGDGGALLAGRVGRLKVNAAHDGHLATGGPVSLPLEKKWSKDLGGYVSYPIVAAGKVFAVARGPENGPYGTYLHAFDASTGATA